MHPSSTFDSLVTWRKRMEKPENVEAKKPAVKLGA
jgi:hypothetical protein